MTKLTDDQYHDLLAELVKSVLEIGQGKDGDIIRYLKAYERAFSAFRVARDGDYE